LHSISFVQAKGSEDSFTNMAKRIRIKDIAAKAKVSTGTVDRVLHNRGNVSAEKRARIEAVMEDLGYEPNIIARTLASNREVRIAILVPDPGNDPYWSAPSRGVEQAWQSVKHYGVVADWYYFNLFEQDDFAVQAKKVLETNPNALLFPPVFLQAANELLRACHEQNILVSIFNTQVESSSILTYVGQNSYQSGVLAGKLLSLGMGEQGKVAVINLSKEPANAKHLSDKEQGLIDYFSSRKMGADSRVIRIVFEKFNDRQALRNHFEDLFAREPSLRALFITNSRAYKLLEVLPEYLTENMRIVGFDLLPENIEFLRRGRIQFLINQNPVEQGYLALMSLVNTLIFEKEVMPIQHLPLDIVVSENVDYYLHRAENYALTV